MSAVSELNDLVAETGYTQADVEALRLLAEARSSPENAARIVLVAKRRGCDPVQLAQQMINRRRLGNQS